MGWSIFKRDNRKVREAWEADLVWFRLRYFDGTIVTRGLQLLSRTNSCGRIALYYHFSSSMPTLYIAVASEFVSLLKQMAADFGFQLTPLSAEKLITPIQPLAAAKQLPIYTTFTAHIVDEQLFVSVEEDGDFMPTVVSAENKPQWSLSQHPPLGISTTACWEPQPIREHLFVDEPSSDVWLLGRTQQGDLIQSGSRRVNLYGRQEAVAHWLTQLVVQSIWVAPANLIVIDGTGDLVPNLKRKTTIASGLGETIRYIDLDSSTAVTGFNPLAPLPTESQDAYIERLQQWVRHMGLSADCEALIQNAIQDNIETLAELQKWLQQRERQGTNTAIDSFKAAIARLTRNGTVREWLDWPTNPYDILPDGTLLFSCKMSGWDTQQLLRGVLLAALAMPSSRLICHGISWELISAEKLAAHPQIVLSNAPCSAESAIVITQTHNKGLRRLAQHFNIRGERLLENMRLMTAGEALLFENTVTDKSQPILTSWHTALGFA